ncbi:KRAB [Mytilus edulis]|uniref:KRAB n=1 Tax=Mytilus edulis TaxID=6550 RepID=A0A8S3TR02_MYTED|nr:KRAB [Mytilus edulis]
MPCKTKKEIFLSNIENKQQFINLLSSKLSEKGCKSFHAPGDADTLIVQTAVSCAANGGQDVVLVGEDTDLVLLCYHADMTTRNIYFKSDTQKKTAKKFRIWDNMSHLCKHCGKKFKGRSGLRQHEMRHDGQGPYSCNECKLVFFSKSNFTSHLASETHQNHKPFICKTCGKSFATDAYLKNHCLYEDKGGDHKCTQCEATFSRASHLKDHMDMHTGIKSNICKICGKAYRFRSSLSRHSKTHEVAEGLSYECDICNKTFTQKRYLQEHKKAHNTESAKCTFCSKVFKSKRYLQGQALIFFWSLYVLKLKKQTFYRIRKSMA